MQKKFIKGASLLPMLLCLTSLASCSKQEQTVADTVVYSTIYTSNAKQEYVEAFAIKDHKYVYVGSKEGAKNYIKEGTTKVIDKSSGFVMSGATEGHGHYVMSSVLKSKGLICSAKTIDDAVAFAKSIVEADKEKKQTVYFTYGWQNEEIKGVKASVDVRAKLDEFCPDKPLLLIDDTGHNIFMNSKAIEQAGIDKDQKWSIKGGYLSREGGKEDGRLLGLASDIAMNYVVNLVLKPAGVISKSDFATAMKDCEDTLHSNGYTSYLDAYTSYFGDCAYEGISAYDNDEGMTLCMTACYKIDAYENIETQVDKAASLMKERKTTHFNPNNIKVFADGEAFENQSAWVYTPYKNGTYGEQVWDDDKIKSLVERANSQGVSVHAHTSGDHAADQLVDAYIAAESKVKKDAKVINSLGHCAQLTEDTKNKMASHHIPSATNITWRIKPTANKESVKQNFDWDYWMKAYPMKSLLDKGIVMSSSTDYPSNSGCPIDILNIMQIAVKGTVNENLIPSSSIYSLSSDEFITLEQAMDAFTINGAKQLGNDNERGSIEVGKYADFVYLDKNIKTAAHISDANISEVYFEGGLTYTKKA